MVGGAMTFYMVAKAQAGMLTGKSPLFLTSPDSLASPQLV